MTKHPTPFKEPLYVTRPVLPGLDEFAGVLREVWRTRQLTNMGPQHTELEERLRKVLKVPHLSLFNNGTTALLVAFRALGIEGDVVTTPFTFPATVHALTWSGLTPVFCDIDPATMNIDTEKIEEALTPRTSAILAVHVFGTPCDVTAIREIADRRGLRIAYDAAHAFGVEVDGKGIGNFGDISMMSFHATKTFHTAEGGALAFRDAALKTRIYLMKNFGIRSEEEVLIPGINGKMNEIQAALGLLVLDLVEAERKKRTILTEIYRQCLGGAGGIRVPTDTEGVKSNYQYFVIRVDEKKFGRSRDSLCEGLKKFNVFPRKYFHPLCSEYPCYRDRLASASPPLTEAARAAREVLSLPLHGGLSTADVEKICAIILHLERKSPRRFEERPDNAEGKRRSHVVQP